MKKLTTYILLAFAFSLSSCSYLLDNATEECIDPDYSYCDTHEPAYGYLEIKFSENKEHQDSVLINVFQGDFEDDNEVFSGYTRDDDDGLLEISVALNADYSVTALYYKDGKEILAVDGDYFKKSSNRLCDSTCWEISGGRYDVKLK